MCGWLGEKVVRETIFRQSNRTIDLVRYLIPWPDETNKRRASFTVVITDGWISWFLFFLLFRRPLNQFWIWMINSKIACCLFLFLDCCFSVASWGKSLHILFGCQVISLAVSDSCCSRSVSIVDGWSLWQSFRQRCWSLSLKHRCQGWVGPLH